MSINSKIRIYTKDKVKIFINTKKGTIATFNRNKPSEEYCVRKFRGRGPVGYPCNVFSKREEKKTFDEAYISYLEMHPELTEREKEKVLKRVYENLNNTVLRALEDYDLVEVGTNGKYGDYIEAMLKPINKKSEETEKEFLEREKKLRQIELRRAGISITYILGTKIFSKNSNIFDNMKVAKEAQKYNDYARIEFNNNIYGKKNKTLRLRKEEVRKAPVFSFKVPEATFSKQPKKNLKTLRLDKDFGIIK